MTRKYQNFNIGETGMTFEEWYFELKSEGKLDREICEMMGICEGTLKRIKTIYDVQWEGRTRKNGQGLSEKELKVAEENGIGRRLALRRVREYNYSNEDAIHTPKNFRRGNFGISAEEKRFKQAQRQREYYLIRKLGL